MKNILILTNKEKTKAVKIARKISGWLKKQKIPDIKKFAIVLGGDGTMIKSSRQLAKKNIPLFGVNLGKMGFLAETNAKNAGALLKKIIAGNYKTEERNMLEIDIYRGKKLLHTFTALNDAVIKNGRTARVINLKLFINRKFVSDIVGDGIIVSTPTGSTAYSLAAGGPIVHPKTKNIILTPIAPHALTQRPVIIPDDYLISVVINSNHKDVMLSVDGQKDLVLSMGDTVRIRKSKTPVRLITAGSIDYFELLRKKFNWGKR